MNGNSAQAAAANAQKKLAVFILLARLMPGGARWSRSCVLARTPWSTVAFPWLRASTPP